MTGDFMTADPSIPLTVAEAWGFEVPLDDSAQCPVLARQIAGLRDDIARLQLSLGQASSSEKPSIFRQIFADNQQNWAAGGRAAQLRMSNRGPDAASRYPNPAADKLVLGSSWQRHHLVLRPNGLQPVFRGHRSLQRDQSAVQRKLLRSGGRCLAATV